MRSAVHSLFPIVLCLFVVLTGQGVAVSRGVDKAVGQMVLCTGNGPVVVYMDENGQPTAPPHYCPDYALTLLGAVAIAQPSLPQAPLPEMPPLLRASESLIAPPVPQTPARAPPSIV